MKKILLLFFILSVFVSYLSAGTVDREVALTVAKNFILHLQTIARTGTAELTLTYTEISHPGPLMQKSKQEAVPLFYVFNVNLDEGFVIVSGDDRIEPVLGFSVTGSYPGRDLPPAFRKLLEKYKQEILYVITNELDGDEETAARWKNLENGRDESVSKSVKAVNPLMSTTWNQHPYENEMCPYDPSGPGGHCVTGCPATTMSQIMKYWNYPQTGTGFHSYNTNYGTLSADFGSTTYDWGAMPDHLNSSNDAVALINFHAGVAVEMTYGPDGSYGWVIENDDQGNHPACCQVAYQTYFGYASTMFGAVRAHYSDADWKQLLYTDLDAGRPVQYAGFGSGGHTWVCDGYDGDYFHMNWGWGGQGDGFFYLDALNVGSNTFNNNQQALLGIQPSQNTTTTSLTMYTAITVNPSPVSFGQGFSVKADVLNSGTENFKGDYCAALFTSDGTFIDFVQILTEENGLPPNFHYTDGITFTSTGIAAATPGSYTVGIFSRPAGGGWTLVTAGTYTNPVDVTVEGSANDIQLFSRMIVDHDPIVVKEPFTVTVDIINNGSSTFNGNISLDLHSSDGKWVQTIEEFTDTLQAGYYFDNVVFSCQGLDVEPGNYYLVVWDMPTGSDWALVGSGTYSNPIEVLVTGKPLSPDVYESNNAEATSTILPVNFAGNSANCFTDGSNIHNGTDVDYYKISLPAGNGYTVNARVHDSYNSGNGQTYTGDVMFSWKTGTDWSDTYDDVMPSAILLPNGGTVVFYTAPYYPGMNGTYLLEIGIARNAMGLEEAGGTGSIAVFPNPARDKVTFSIYLDQPEILMLTLENVFGQKVLDIAGGSFSSGKIKIPVDVSSLAPGYYVFKAQTGDSETSGKLIITK